MIIKRKNPVKIYLIICKEDAYIIPAENITDIYM
jgi:hypothetical protein